MQTRTEQPTPVRTVEPASYRENLVTVGLSLWMVAGVVLDGWAHATRGGGLESFFTPWHAVLYSGFAAVASWIAWTAYKRRSQAASWRGAIPSGYGLGLLGAFIFAAGGAGDMAWHQIFGIEVGVEALMSPSHVALFVGAVLVLSTPLRATPRGSTRLLPAILSLALTTELVTFFFMYISTLTGPTPSRGLFQWLAGGLDRSNPGFGFAEMWTVRMTAQIFVTNAILVGAALFFVRRWRPPVGTFSTVFSAVALLTAAVDGFGDMLVPSALIFASVLVDVLARLVRPSPDSPYRIWAFAAGVPVVVWSMYFAAVHTAFGLGWPPEIWSGLICLTSLTGLGLAALAAPAERAAAA